MPGEEEWCSERVRRLFLGFLFFCFVILHKKLLNSTPQLLAAIVAPGAQLGPGDLEGVIGGT